MFFVWVGRTSTDPDRFIGPFLRLSDATEWAVARLPEDAVFTVKRMISPVEGAREWRSRAGRKRA